MMKIPVMRGMIDRRILVNYQVDPDVLADILPAPFRPKQVKGAGIAGICLIRLKQIRPRFIPSKLGIFSENAAHRIAVEWEQAGETKEGVYIPRRDTSSYLNSLAGSRLFPGVHHLAQFAITETEDKLNVHLNDLSHDTYITVEGRVGDDLPESSVFSTVQEASNFFEQGALGYSATKKMDVYDGLELRTLNWSVRPLTVDVVRSSFFEDNKRFPTGSVRFDSALLMRDIDHEWHAHPPLHSINRQGVI